MVPDVGSLAMPGARAESNARHKGEESEGLRGLKSLGVRDLHHRMAFLVSFYLYCSHIDDKESNHRVEIERDKPSYWRKLCHLRQY